MISQNRDTRNPQPNQKLKKSPREMNKFHSYSEFEKLNEGRYDRVTGRIVDEIWKIIRVTRKIYEINPESDTYAKELED